MGIILNGSKPSKIIYNGAESSLYFNGSKIWPEEEPAPDPPLPPIAANTVRVRTSDGNVPNNGYYESATLVTGTTNVYDCYSSWFAGLLANATNVVEILGVNPGNQTDLNSLCAGCTSLTTIALFDTSNITDISYAFANCTNVESGALALYQQASTQANPPSNHISTFKDCGSNTVTGAAELAQIPSEWK